MNNRGFLSLEVILGLLISSLILGLILPGLGLFRDLEREYEFQTFVRNIENVRNRAIFSNSDYGLELVDNKTYRLFNNRDLGPGGRPYNKSIKFKSDLEIYSSNYANNNSYNKIYFSSEGTISRAGSIVLSSKAWKRKLYLRVNTGKIRIEEI